MQESTPYERAQTHTWCGLQRRSGGSAHGEISHFILFYFQLLCSKIGCHLYFSSHFQSYFLFHSDSFSRSFIRLCWLCVSFLNRTDISGNSNGCGICDTFFCMFSYLDWNLALWLTVPRAAQIQKKTYESVVSVRYAIWQACTFFSLISVTTFFTRLLVVFAK